MMLQEKNIVVTGSNRGIGKAIVYKLAAEGANIWACARNKSEEFEEEIKSLSSKSGVIIEPVYFDLMNEGDVKDAVKGIVKSKRPIDGLVNNAGKASYNKLQLIKIEDIREIFDNNYFSALYLTQLIMRRMTKNTGSIVFLSSISGFVPEIGNIAYGGSKAAIAHTTKVLSKELAAQGIRVNAVAPGMVNTSMKLKADEGVWNDLIARTSLKRAAEPEEIANVICCLSSDLSSYVNGQVVRVDGGMN